LNDSLKVALLSPEYPPLSIGGISAVCYDLSMNLSRQGVHATVFCGKSDKLTVEKVNDNLRVVRMPLLGFPPKHLWFQIQNLSPLLKMLKEFDVVHNVDPRGAFLAYFGRKLHKPFVTHVHGSGYGETKVFLRSPVSCWTLGDFVYEILEYPMNEYLTNMCLRNSDHLVVCSTNRVEEMKRRNRDLDFTKVSVIYNGIDFEKIDSKGVVTEEKGNSVLYWGRLYYNKGILQLIKAISLVKKEFSNVLLDVCGKGPLETKIRVLLRKLDLEGSVYIHGYVSEKDLTEKIRTASVVALPSLYEGQPIAALEAMAYKKPVIMYDFPFAREYITDWHNGLLAKGGDVKDFAQRICAVLWDKKLRLKLGQNGYEHVKKNHSWTTLICKYVDLYNDLTQ
jgi:glycosyltransferase involved in cell wall biosynthesis